MLGSRYAGLLSAAALLMPLAAGAQERGERADVEGTAVIRVDDAEYTIPILCFGADAAGGFYTEPSRITREKTGRTSMVNLRVGPGEPDELVVNLDRYVAWIPATGDGSRLSATLDMSPASIMENGMPTLLTRDRWMDGERPEGLNGVFFESRCGYRDPKAPAYRKLPTGG